MVFESQFLLHGSMGWSQIFSKGKKLRPTLHSNTKIAFSTNYISVYNFQFLSSTATYIICGYMCLPLPTCIYTHIHATTFAYIRLYRCANWKWIYLPTCDFLPYIPLNAPTCAYMHLQAPTCAYIHIQAPIATCAYMCQHASIWVLKFLAVVFRIWYYIYW